jgi:predicted nucleotidyltransferase
MINKKELLKRVFLITEYNAELVEDVCLAGSRYWGNPKESSDYDIIVYVKSIDRPTILRGVYCKKLLSIKIDTIDNIDKPFWNKFILPKESLITGHIYGDKNNNIKEYLEYRGRANDN